MSAPGAGGEAPLPNLDSAPRATGDPSKSALGAGREGSHSAHNRPRNAVVPAALAVAGAARDQLQAVALEAPQARLAV
eukprot:CAMPEP_0118809536 /NCGR_PEP_ID=MMETSP1162-20130426/344_1 /TAXON_ID=33656 /ORGANISM="Phaeocystis Sp, Strain CCMP2710" /LENGTH=77 /DNA_ID=CAMNT_0006738975 /DNA_START=228 /DNA_END=459 /DNA_ORIENTATION=+